MDFLPIPKNNDSLEELSQKIKALASAVQQGKSIAAITSYAASMTQEREPLSKAVTEMRPYERESWEHYTTGKYPLPEMDWVKNRNPAPISTTPLKVARRRAEALNRPYDTTPADAGNSVWFTEHELVHLPLVKAMARIIGAERNLLGGQIALKPKQLADLQTINRVLSITSEMLKKAGANSFSKEIASAQQALVSRRDALRAMLQCRNLKRKVE